VKQFTEVQKKVVKLDDRPLRSLQRARLANALAVVAVLALACGEPGETISEAERGRSEGTILKLETEGEKGIQAEIGEQVKLPADFPRDVPVYPGAVAQAAFARSAEGMLVSFRSSDSKEEVFEFYASELESSGWEIEGEMEVGGQRMLTAVKQDRQAVLTIMGDETGVGVTIALAPRR
jgi:hypothetical protein